MSQLVYNLSIQILKSVYFLASFFNAKAKQFVDGRRDIYNQLKITFVNENARVIWVHCASLGEFEQGRPIMEALKEKYPTTKILLTFFSPSGYEIRKNYRGADAVFYLPWDTPSNAKRFVEIVKPSMAIFVKYEFWHNYSSQLREKSIPLISISCILRPDQVFFKSYGSLFRKILKNFDYFFVQNKETQELLNALNIKSTLAGDTRFDRVMQIVQSSEEISIAKKFKSDQKLLVAGSCWPEDMDVLVPLINENKDRLKFIIAPHEITEGFISSIEKSLEVKSVRYSKADETSSSDFSVLIIDNIGMLSRLYRYGEFAYVGGAFGAGLHNILEAACYGVPIFFGNKNYKKYQEATDLIMLGGAFEVSGFSELKAKYELMNNMPESFLLACEVTRSYVQENLGATKKIMDYCSTLLSKS
ncbi:MAG: 3-deoxy-D-manno-octulosonic acid transferase [Cyclobacteriaceae bacterium]